MIGQVSRKARRLSIQSAPDLVRRFGDAVAQHATDEGVNEFAERAMVERERPRIEVWLAPVKARIPRRTPADRREADGATSWIELRREPRQ